MTALSEAAELRLPNLQIGVGSSALQIEGALPPTNWHRWADAGHIADGSHPDHTTDHWNRWREDNALMSELGLQAARLGIEWARVEPEPGRVDHDALARYRDELTDLTARGITPIVTLHHFGNPLWIEDAGAWENPATIGAFWRHIDRVLDATGDLVTDWITINEPNVYAAQGYLWREGPPGVVSPPRLWRVLRHLAVAHIGAYERIHRHRPAARVTFAHHRRAWAPRDPANPLHRAGVPVVDLLFHRIVEEAFFRGRFHPLLGVAAARRHRIRPGRYADAIGLNYYSRTAVSGLSDATLPDVPVTDLGWEIHPAGLIDAAAALHRRYRLPIWITENGCADATDRIRPRFVLDHLAVIARSDLPIERYLHWCFVDNWEWSDGMAPRFGIVARDDDDARTIKPSGHLLARIIRTGVLTPDLWRSAQPYERQPHQRSARA